MEEGGEYVRTISVPNDGEALNEDYYAATQ